jgi:hypothetical protein
MTTKPSPFTLVRDDRRPDFPALDKAQQRDAQLLVDDFRHLVDAWRLTLSEQMTLAGIDRATMYAWRTGAVAPLDPAVAERLSRLLAVDTALRARLARPDRVHEWLRKPNRSPLLLGQAPLDQLLHGTGDALGTVAYVAGTP